MRYPGNATISRDIQDRILSTFEQTLAAATEGNRREAQLGCDFILRLDSLFEPARQLQQRLESGEGPVETTDLSEILAELQGAVGAGPDPDPQPAADQPAAGDSAEPVTEPVPAIDGLDDLDLSLDGDAEPAPAAPPAIDPLDDLTLAPAPDAAASPAAAEAELPAAEAPPVEAPPVEAPPVEAPPVEAPPVEVASVEVASVEAPPAETPPAEAAAAIPPPDPTSTEPAAEAPAPQPEAAAPAAASDDLADLDVGGEPSAAEPADEGIALDAEPAARLDNESEQRVEDLLAEGQAAFDKGEYQGAIDAWSRIFLIDIDHPEANSRIEQARKLKAEADRQIEERFHEGVAQVEAGDLEAAADTFRAVLAAQPAHLAARDYLEKLEAGEVPVVTESKPSPEEQEADLAVPDIPIEDEAPSDESKPKPDRGSKPVGTRMVTVKRSPFRSPTFLVLAGIGVALVAAGGWYLSTNWSRLFPNSAEEPAPAADSRPDPLARAKALHEEGKTPMAVAQLRRLPPAHPQYAEAQALIAQWEAPQATGGEADVGVPAEQLELRAELVAGAEQAAGGGEYLRASELLAEAAAIAPLKGAEVQRLARADEQLQELQNLITLFRQGDWDFVLRDLWLLREQEPDNADVTRLLVDAYYNLGVRDLQRNDAAAAGEKLREALGLAPQDPELRRLVRFAETYQKRPADLMYRIFVKYLPFR